MALRIYPIRPLRPRGYYGQQGTPAAAFSGGEAMGKMAGGAMLEFQKWQAQQKQKQQQDQLNALANRMENTVTPPRAGLVSAGVNPVTGQGNVVGANVPTAGTAPFSAGAAGMQLQQNFIKSQLENQRLAQEVRNQGIAANLQARRGGGGGGSGNASRWQQYLGQGKTGNVDQFGNPVKAGKPAAYVPGSSTVNDPANYYNFNHQRADIDAEHGKGTNDRLLAGVGQLGPPDPKTGIRTTPDAKVDADGNVIKPPSMSVDKDGNVTLAPKGSYPGAYLPADEAQKNMARNDATVVKGGGQPRFIDNYLKTQHPEAGLPGGDAANPYLPKSNLDLDAIPPGKSYVDPTDNKVYTKQPPQKSAAQQPPTKGTTQVDTGDQSQQVASLSPQPQTQPPPLLSLSSGQPQPPAQGLTGGDQGQGGQDYTGGQPQLSQLSPVTPQAPVDLAAVSGANTPSSFNLGQPASGGLPQDQQLADEIKRTQMANYLQGVA
jgi:hypothetical protein